MKKYELRYLSEEFYAKYPPETYPELERKPTRPYMVMLVTIADNTFAIPFRTNVRHKNCYRFKHTSRDTESVTGLDYTKAVIINDSTLLGDPATIDDKEYLELSEKHYFIIKQFTAYVNGYLAFVKGELNEYKARQYQFTTLQYFHHELHIQD